ncbi:MAG: glycosyltransferase family 4 protein [Rhodothermales bacterium]|nr:glycosyltransferase family 4 protein [Rhodothermales bacterium]
MKIAMTHADLPNETKGGVAYQAHYMANALIDRGHDVTMFTFSPAFDECKYPVHQLGPRRFPRRLQSFEFAGALARTDFSTFDVVHTHGDNYLMRNVHPQVRTFHGSAQDEATSSESIKRKIYQSVMARLERAGAVVADSCVGISGTTKNRISRINRIIPCGVDTTNFVPGEKSDQPTVLFVGALHGRKRGKLLASIYNDEIRPQVPDAVLWTVSDLPLEGTGIVNYGRVSLEKLTELYQQAWVFCLPSTYEGFGVPYIEAMGAGTPVVATPNPGSLEVLQNGESGLLPEDNELGAAIVRLLQNADERQSLVEKGFVRVRDFSWPKIVDQYEEVYRQAMGTR